MGKSILFINEKGGIGKTSLCFNLAWELSKKKKILLIDMDGQRSNLTFFCNVKKTDEMNTIYDVLMRNTPIKEVIVNVKENLDIVPATSTVSSLSQVAKISKMKAAVKEVINEYDYIFCDVSPSPNWGHSLALSACQYALIPCEPEVACVEALNGIVESIDEIKENSNANLKTLGIVFNSNTDRTNQSKFVKDCANLVAKKLDTVVFDTTIRNSVKVSECVASHVGVTDYAHNSSVAQDFVNLVREMEKRING
jgi:chromosome partitioning protein